MGILNAVNDAVQGVSNLTKGALGGSLAQPNINLFGTNIPGVPLISFRDYFINSMETWVGAIPLRTQWVVLIDGFPAGLNTSILQGLEPTQGDKKGFNIDRAKAFLTSYPAQSVVGCLFAQGADIPDDTLQTSVATIPNNRGFIPGRISGNRSEFSPLTLQFRETNSSFIDHVIRPWVIMASHAGMVARDDKNKPELDPRCNITIVQYTRSYKNVSQIPRKVWNFYNCVPTGVSSRNLTYDAEQMDTYSSQWYYSNYTVSDNLFLPLPDIINKLF
tara:strand:+ start:304 stop:1128 length:825 start_codon:yes stop_codon:yes gene_type:complete